MEWSKKHGICLPNVEWKYKEAENGNTSKVQVPQKCN